MQSALHLSSKLLWLVAGQLWGSSEWVVIQKHDPPGPTEVLRHLFNISVWKLIQNNNRIIGIWQNKHKLNSYSWTYTLRLLPSVRTWVVIGIYSNVQSLHDPLVIRDNTGIDAFISGGKWLQYWIMKLKRTVTGVARTVVELNQERVCEIPCDVHSLWRDPPTNVGIICWRMTVDGSNVSTLTCSECTHILYWSYPPQSCT